MQSKGAEMSSPTKQEQELIDRIEQLDYEQLLRLWRFEPNRSPYFTGAVGERFVEVINDKKSKLSEEARVEASKRVGWGS
jgi:hypothetical protein